MSSPSYCTTMLSFALEDFSGSSVVIKLSSFVSVKATWCVDLFEKIDTLRIEPSSMFLSTVKLLLLSFGITLL